MNYFSSVNLVDLILLSADEFEALPDETLRRMRGDFG